MKNQPLLLLGPFLLLTTACTRTVSTMTPQGMVETKESFPQYNSQRTQKDIYLSLNDQNRFRRYYRRNRSWPLSEQGFTAESDTNYQLVKELRRRGFTDLDFISRGPDSLRIRFEFQTLGNLQYDVERSANVGGLGRAFTGSFLFVADPVSGISFQQQMDKRGREWYWPFKLRPLAKRR